jgi:hypothetical protein
MARRKQAAGATRAAAKTKTATRTAKTKMPAARQKPKQQRMIEMLRRPEGATIPQMSKAFGWEQHTVRGALSGALKKKLGLKIASEKLEGGDRVYRIV